VPLFAFGGALGAGAFVFRIATSAGRVSIPALLLMGLALNTILAALLQWIRPPCSTTTTSRAAILSWSFGTLDDRTAPHALLVWGGLALALAALPFISYELDLMQTGLDGRRGAGVDTARVRWIAPAPRRWPPRPRFAVAGQIAFVGLIVPHLARCSPDTRTACCSGPRAASGAVPAGRRVPAEPAARPRSIPPGVMLSLIGGPFFLVLLWNKRRELALW